jgi:ankyrin repeat protein
MGREDRCALHRRLMAVEEACRRGDLAAFRATLGDPPDFPNGLLPEDFMALGDRPLVIALIHGPPDLVRALLDLGADPNVPAQDGFPSLHAAIDAPRADRHALLRLLLERGADPNAQRGINDGTPLHHAVWRRDLEAVRLLLAHGADPGLRTRIDDRTTPREEAAAMGFAEAVALLG